MIETIFAFFFWIILTFVVGAVGASRKIGFWGAFFLSLFLSPIIGIIIVALSDRKKPPEVRIVNPVQYQVSKPQPLGTSFADEFMKLKKLHDEGHITDEEFAQLKQKLVS